MISGKAYNHLLSLEKYLHEPEFQDIALHRRMC
jgi:hypothetical protein